MPNYMKGFLIPDLYLCRIGWGDNCGAVTEGSVFEAIVLTFDKAFNLMASIELPIAIFSRS